MPLDIYSPSSAVFSAGAISVTTSSLKRSGGAKMVSMSASATERRRNRALRAAVRPLGRRLREKRSIDEIWQVIKEGASLFGASAVHVRVASSPANEGTPLSFSYELEGETTNRGNPFRYQFIVPGGKASERVLELIWCDGRREIDRDTEIAIDLLCEYLGDAFEDLRSARIVTSEGVTVPRPTHRN